VNAEIIAIGSELLTPFRQDTNSLYLTDQLNRLGIAVTRKTIIGDEPRGLASAIGEALDRAGLVLCMGGLGPTADDLTREAAAEALGVELRRDHDIVSELYARFAKLRIKMPEINTRQADMVGPAAIALPNSQGTAPGQWIDVQRGDQPRILLLLPGPPNELKPMFEQHCLARLRAAAPPMHMATRVLKIAMLPESQCDARVAPIYARHTEVETTILAGAGEVQIHLRARHPERDEAERRVDALADELEDELQDFVYSSGGESLEQIVGYYLEMRGATIAVAESCTAGLLGERLTSVSGSSRYFLGGAIVYSNELKTAFAGVPPQLIDQHGAVSAQVAQALAEGIRERTGARLGVAITGVAGPTGGTEEKPVGLVFHALADGNRTDIRERRYPGDRERVRWWASQQALDMIRRKLI
jgi:nicotinamide-nucleotide amidase